MASLYTTQTLMSIIIKISIGISALSILLWYSITFYVLLQIQRMFQWSSKMQWATTFKANHLLDILWMSIGRKMQIVTFSKFQQKFELHFALISKDQKL